MSAADSLFHRLDGTELQNGSKRWQTEVYSVQQVGTDWWIQMALNGPSRHSLVVHLARHADVSDAVHAAEGWLESADPTTTLIHVT